MIIDLTKGLGKYEQYEAFKFLGGEVHVKLNMEALAQLTLKDIRNDIIIRVKLNSSDDIILLLLVLGTLKKDADKDNIFYNTISVEIPYMAYQQADRDFGIGESFSLDTICALLRSMDVKTYTVFDQHSPITAALLRAKIVDNSEFIKVVLNQLRRISPKLEETLCILSPDAGAYKKIGDLIEKIGWKGEVVAANKHRQINTGNIDKLDLSIDNFQGKDVLIIDDICMKGGTFIGLGEKLKEKGAGKCFLAVSHMISKSPNLDLWRYFKKVFTTNSRWDEYSIPDEIAFPLYVHKII